MQVFIEKLDLKLILSLVHDIQHFENGNAFQTSVARNFAILFALVFSVVVILVICTCCYPLLRTLAWFRTIQRMFSPLASFVHARNRVSDRPATPPLPLPPIDPVYTPALCGDSVMHSTGSLRRSRCSTPLSSSQARMCSTPLSGTLPRPSNMKISTKVVANSGCNNTITVPVNHPDPRSLEPPLQDSLHELSTLASDIKALHASFDDAENNSIFLRENLNFRPNITHLAISPHSDSSHDTDFTVHPPLDVPQKPEVPVKPRLARTISRSPARKFAVKDKRIDELSQTLPHEKASVASPHNTSSPLC